MAEPLRIGDRWIGPGHPVYIVAELSANHLNDFDRAMDLVRCAADAGADAIKLQTYTPDTITIDSDGAPFTIGPGTPWEGRRLHEVYAEASMPWDWQPKLADLARDLGLDCFSSPFDPSAVAFLEKMNVPAYKIASFELVDTGLIACAARTGKPLIMSTGMADREDIETALHAARAAGAQQIALLKCTSAYPCPPEDLNLRTLRGLQEDFDVVIGLSDHTLDDATVIAAVALGACIIERHFTLDRNDGGPDASFSLEPAEFRSMASAIRLTEKSLGEVRYQPTDAERETRRFRRSLFVVEDIAAGEPITTQNVRSIRPADGLAPKHLDDALGRPAARDLSRGTPLSFEDLA
ncbi:MAG: pseudaminic acid synthase [Deltaproteobacteria bacterium]|nr:pseudaminic acid synthase [Deltaproteobacteria bacterium]